MKAFFTTIAANLATIALCVVAGFILIIGIVATAGGDKPVVVRKGSVLVIDLDQSFVDAPTPAAKRSFLDDALARGDNTMPLRATSVALRAAAGDDDISAVYIRGNITPTGYGSGYAALRELRAAIADFRRSKKPVHAYLVNPDTRDYYVASAASTITLDPFGSLMLPGMAAEQMFFAGLLEKYGIGVQVSRVGRFKAAVEPFTRKDMSAESRLQTRMYLSEMWSEVKRGISESRGIDTTVLQAVVDAQGIILPADARAAGLVDRVAYFDVVLADLERLAGVRPPVAQRQVSDTAVAEATLDSSTVSMPADAASSRLTDLLGPTLPQVSLEAYAPIAAARVRTLSAKQSVAIVYAEGDIVDGQGGTGTIGGDRLARDLRRIRGDKGIKAVVLRVNSPGGSAIASEKIQRELKLLRTSKPLVVSMGSLAASGGYWIATAATRIFAQPNTITGSIGVFALVPNIKGLANNHGVTFDTVTTGRYAGINSLARPRTDDEMRVLQRGTDAVYDAFIDRVAQSRTLTTDSVRAIAEGRVWSGTDAVRIGLVDSIGGMESAVASAVAMANLTGDYDIKEFPRQRSATEILTEMLDRKPEPVASMGVTAALTGRGPARQLSRDIMQQLQALLSFDDPRSVYARLPYVLSIR